MWNSACWSGKYFLKNNNNAVKWLSETIDLISQVALLDVAEATGTTLKKSLDGQYGPERTLFIPCDVQSQQQFKGPNTEIYFGYVCDSM